MEGIRECSTHIDLQVIDFDPGQVFLVILIIVFFIAALEEFFLSRKQRL